MIGIIKIDPQSNILRKRHVITYITCGLLLHRLHSKEKHKIQIKLRIHKRLPIDRPWGRAMGSLLWALRGQWRCHKKFDCIISLPVLVISHLFVCSHTVQSRDAVNPLPPPVTMHVGLQLAAATVTMPCISYRWISNTSMYIPNWTVASCNESWCITTLFMISYIPRWIM